MKHNSFWPRVKQQIKAHKYSQKKLANYINVPVTTLWGWIYHDRVPDVITACCIAEALGVTVEFLVRGSDDINADEKLKRTFDRKIAAKQIHKFALKIGAEAEQLKL